MPVAGRPLDDDAARPREAALLGILDDEEHRTVLERAARVQKFGFAEDRASGLLGGAPQFDEGRIADHSDKSRRGCSCLAPPPVFHHVKPSPRAID